jgi:hypothetical protein
MLVDQRIGKEIVFPNYHLLLIFSRELDSKSPIGSRNDVWGWLFIS